jgi:hypothetical protein
MDGTGDLFALFVAALGPDVSTAVVRYPDVGRECSDCTKNSDRTGPKASRSEK